MAPHQEALSEIALQTRESPVFLCHSQSSQLSDMTGEAGMSRVHHTIGSVLCCKCGIPMTPNAANMCVKCLRTEVDITEGLQKHATLVHCPECDRLIHAEFIWTEPHSKRIKVKLRVQKEVLNGAILEQAYIVEYVQQEHMCESCSRVQANPDQWVASVQVRQHVPHRRTLFYLEQLILMHDAARCAKKIKPMNQGIDFFFANWSHGKKFVEFIGKMVPIKSHRPSQQLVSHDPKSNNYYYKYTLSVEICPICREDLICLPREVASDAEQYWRSPFKALLSSRQLVEYIVLDVGIVYSEVHVGGSKYALADAQVARLSDFGKNDTIFNITTHLGHLLNPGDHALGYDMFATNSNDMELEKYRDFDLPPAILIRKTYEENCQGKGGKPPPLMSREYEEFLRRLEDNPELTLNISLHENKEYPPPSVRDGEEDSACVALEKLLANVDLSDDEDGDDAMAE
ncbi:60S ribosomal export protein NMD3 [Vitis vinifera]|uniref:60S ribosomal export protein NMD3 n=1 Tax=Vitis vinifera TaxID=29760 RepID=A0A438C070_VITVI|nr:60S ribosomal export protein NMD3 [Vitis vinifera]